MRKAVIAAIDSETLVSELKKFSENSSSFTADETKSLIIHALIAIEYLSKSNEVYS